MPLLNSNAAADLIKDDVAIDDTTALLFSAEAPLKPEPGKKDARAVWSRVLPGTDPSVLIYLHGNNNYVTVDAMGRSRVPDWAADNAVARAGASGKPAAPLSYGLDVLETKATGKRPVLLVPEVATLTTGSFWAHEPVGQYADPARMGKMIDDCMAHLAALKRKNDMPYLPGSPVSADLRRVYVSGHSGAGLPLEQAAISSLLLPGQGGVAADLWLFDCTYWSKIDGFIEFCARWKAAGRLNGGESRSARFVCVYKPKTSTEGIADALRTQVAKFVGAPPDSLVLDHTPANYESIVRPALKTSGVQFIRTYLPHDEIPKFYIPALLQTASS